jgi:hypothetical protein
VVPFPWDVTYQARYENAYQQVALHLTATGVMPRVKIIAVGGVNDGNLQVGLPSDEGKGCLGGDNTARWIADGYSAQLVIDAEKAFVATAISAFPAASYVLAYYQKTHFPIIRGQPDVYTNMTANLLATGQLVAVKAGNMSANNPPSRAPIAAHKSGTLFFDQMISGSPDAVCGIGAKCNAQVFNRMLNTALGAGATELEFSYSAMIYQPQIGMANATLLATTIPPARPSS